MHVSCYPIAISVSLLLAACGGGHSKESVVGSSATGASSASAGAVLSPSSPSAASQPALPTIAGLDVFERGMKGHNTALPPTVKGPEYFAYTFASATQLGNLNGDIHYDPVDVFYQDRDYAALKQANGDASWNPADFDPAIAAAVNQYRNLYLIPAGGGASGYHAYTDGLLRHYVQTGDTLSRDVALLASLESAGSNDVTPLSYSLDPLGSREVAFSVKMRLNSEALGQAHRIRTDEFVTAALGHLEAWTASTRSQCLYVRPFMVGLTMQALIDYWDRYRDSRIPGAIKKTLDWLRTNAWDPKDGATPGTGTFYFTDIDLSTLDPVACANLGYSTDPTIGRVPAPDLSLLIAPAYAWYYWYSRDETYRGWAEEAWLGSSGVAANFWAQKQYNQSYRWSRALLDWRDRGYQEWPAATSLAIRQPAQWSGRANAPSEPFTVSLSGRRQSVSGPVTITPNDGGAGGIFYPAAFRITTDHPLAIFRYRPASSRSGSTQISVQNNGSLRNPAPVTYTVSSVAPTATGYTIAGPTSGNVGQPVIYTVELYPVGSVPPASVDAAGGIVLIGLNDAPGGWGASGGTGSFWAISPWPGKGSVLLSAERPSMTITYTPGSSGAVSISSSTAFDGMPSTGLTSATTSLAVGP